MRGPLATPPAPRGKALVVAAGILLSRIAGLVRQSIFAHFFGNSAAADAFTAAFRIPNILQQLFGEGVLSASFIPVYSKLLGQGEEKLANQLAWTVGAILAAITSGLVAIGIAATPWLIAAIAPGFHGEKRELTITLVRILFPGTGLLVMSAWCLGVLNSHHRFFASYAAPVAWNAVIVASLLIFGGHRNQAGLAAAVAWGAVIGAGLQLAVQLPQTIALVRSMNFNARRIAAPLRTVINNFLPVVTGRGVVQISGYIDNLLASLLPTGAVAALNYAQLIYMLPVSLFGMAVAAAELPAMSQARGTPEEIASILRTRLDAGLRQIAFLVVPAVAAFVGLGDVIAGALFQSGQFTAIDARYVWAILAGAGIGLLATTMGRLYTAAFYAILDTRTPLIFSLIDVALTLVLGYLCAIPLPRILGIAPRWGVVGLTASAGLSGWLEFSMLRSRLNRRIGASGIEFNYIAKLWAIAIGAALVGFTLKQVLPIANPRLVGLAVIPSFGLVYLALAWSVGVPELDVLARRFGDRI
jgi:putative peptidoglycan lipid II flippase